MCEASPACSSHPRPLEMINVEDVKCVCCTWMNGRRRSGGDRRSREKLEIYSVPHARASTYRPPLLLPDDSNVLLKRTGSSCHLVYRVGMKLIAFWWWKRCTLLFSRRHVCHVFFTLNILEFQLTLVDRSDKTFSFSPACLLFYIKHKVSLLDRERCLRERECGWFQLLIYCVARGCIYWANISMKFLIEFTFPYKLCSN